MSDALIHLADVESVIGYQAPRIEALAAAIERLLPKEMEAFSHPAFDTRNFKPDQPQWGAILDLRNAVVTARVLAGLLLEIGQTIDNDLLEGLRVFREKSGLPPPDTSASR